MSKKTYVNYRKISYFLNQKLWFQFDILMQRFILLAKNSSNINISGSENKLWDLNQKNLFRFYHIFKKSLFPNLLYKTVFILFIGIIRIDLKFLEDKLIFLENHLINAWKIYSYKILDFPLILLELLRYKVLSGNNNIAIEYLDQIKYLKNLKLGINSKNEFLIREAIELLTIRLNKKIIPEYYSVWINNIQTSCYTKCINELTKIKVIKGKNFNFDIKNNLMYFCCKIKNLEKENWFNVTNFFRFRSQRKYIKCFFEKFQLYTHIFCWSFKKKVYLQDIVYIFLEKSLKKCLRLSYIGRNINLYLPEAELTLQTISLGKKQKIILFKSRQIFKHKFYTSIFEKTDPMKEIREKTIEIVLYKNCSLYKTIVEKKITKI
nr:hypothetical protein 1634Bnrm1_p159 [Cryptomonas sp.]